MINDLTPSDGIRLTIVSTEFVGINAIVITPLPTAVASDVNDRAGMSNGFVSRRIRALSAKTGPMMTSGFVASAPLIASDALVAVSKNDTDMFLLFCSKIAVVTDVCIVFPIAEFFPLVGKRTAILCCVPSDSSVPYISIWRPYCMAVGLPTMDVSYPSDHVPSGAVVAQPASKAIKPKNFKKLFIYIEKSILFCIILL